MSKLSPEDKAHNEWLETLKVGDLVRVHRFIHDRESVREAKIDEIGSGRRGWMVLGYWYARCKTKRGGTVHGWCLSPGPSPAELAQRAEKAAYDEVTERVRTDLRHLCSKITGAWKLDEKLVRELRALFPSLEAVDAIYSKVKKEA